MEYVELNRPHCTLTHDHTNQPPGHCRRPYQDRVEDCTRVLGRQLAVTLHAMTNLAARFGELGKHSESLKLQEKVRPLYKQVFGPEHRDTLKAMSNLARLWKLTGPLADGMMKR
jgi:hypothetical protein